MTRWWIAALIFLLLAGAGAYAANDGRDTFSSWDTPLEDS